MKIKVKADTKNIVSKPAKAKIHWLVWVALIVGVISISSNVYLNLDKVKKTYVNLQK